MNRTVTIAPVRKTITVKAAPERAFAIFTQRIDAWWPRDHHIGKSPMKAAVMEPRAGGRWYEIGEDDSECDWGAVTVWEPPSRLVLSWQLNVRFERDPATASVVEITFTALADGTTRVDLEHRGLERLGAEDGERLRNMVDSPNGWTGVLACYARESTG